MADRLGAVPGITGPWADGEVLLHEHLSTQVCRDVVTWLDARHLPFYVEASSGLYASAEFEQAGRATVTEYTRREKGEDSPAVTVRDLFPETVFGADPVRDDADKISFILSSYQDHLDATVAFPDLTSGTWGGAGHTALFGDLAVDEVDKARGVDAVLAHYGAYREDAIAVGDAAVDLPMIRYCGTGVTMGDAGDEVKAEADLVTDAVEDDGLAHALVRLGLVPPAQRWAAITLPSLVLPGRLTRSTR